MPLRLLVINNILTPYNTSFFEAVSHHPDVAARTVLLAENDSNRQWQVDQTRLDFDYRVLPSLHSYISSIELPLYLHWGLWHEMRAFRPDVIAICGYHYFATLEVLAFARAHGARTVLWSGSHLLSGFIKRAWVDAYKRWVIKRFDAYLTYGTAARDQLVHYGAPADRVVVGCNTVDVKWFRARADVLRRAVPAGTPTRILYVGRLVSLKNVSALIDAVGRLQKKGLSLALDIVGDGPLRSELAEQVAKDEVAHVTFRGFVSGDALVDAYANSEVLVLPSLNEPWGLVVNEAAACGVPSIVSNMCGVAPDLIREGETGLVFDPTIPGDLSRALERMVNDSPASGRMGEAARRLVLERGPLYYADRMVAAARLAQTG